MNVVGFSSVNTAWNIRVFDSKYKTQRRFLFNCWFFWQVPECTLVGALFYFGPLIVMHAITEKVRVIC